MAPEREGRVAPRSGAAHPEPEARLGVAGRSADVDAIIADSPGWRGATLTRLRDIIHAADPAIVEVAKWKKPSDPLGAAVFEHDGIVCLLIRLKEPVRLSFEDSPTHVTHRCSGTLRRPNGTQAR